MPLHRFAAENDQDALITLWQQSFPEDSVEEIRSFLSKINLQEECLVAESDGAVVSMVFLLPAELQADVRLPIQYIYAAATRPSYRGRGLFGGLLTQALSVARERGQVASFLRPAMPSLCEYYAKFGYRPFFFCDTLHGGAEPSGIAVRPVSAEEYVKWRDRLVMPFGVRWPARLLEHTVTTENACAVCIPVGERLLIRELFCPRQLRQKVCAALAAYFGCARYECRVPADVYGQPFGLLCPLQPFNWDSAVPPYMGVAFD